MSEIDSTSYFFAYVIVFFLCPWCIYAFYLIRELHFLVKNNKNSFLKQKFTVAWQELKQFRKENPRAKYLYGKAKKWMVITLLLWITGFLILVGIVLF